MKRALALVPFLAAALAFSPQQALLQRPVGDEALELDRRLAAWSVGFSVADAEAGVRYDDAEWSYDLSLSLSLDPVRRTRAEQGALAAERALASARRQAVHRALALHARLWAAAARRRAAELGLERARMRLESARRAKRGPLEIEDLETGVEDARLVLDLARLEEAQARAEAEALGLKGEAESATLRFALPEPRPDLRDRALALRLADDQALGAWRRLIALSAGASYQGDESFSVRVASADLSLTVGLQPNPLPATNDWRWSVGARIALDPAAWMNAERARLAARLRRGEFEERRAQARRDAAASLQRADKAWARLRLAKRRLELARRRVEQGKKRLAAGLIAPLDLLDLRRAALEAEAQLADAWGRYVDAVKAYLDLTGGGWRTK